MWTKMYCDSVIPSKCLCTIALCGVHLKVISDHWGSSWKTQPGRISTRWAVFQRLCALAYELTVCVCIPGTPATCMWTFMSCVNQPEAFYYFIFFLFRFLFVQGAAGGNGEAIGLRSSRERGHVVSCHGDLWRAVSVCRRRRSHLAYGCFLVLNVNERESWTCVSSRAQGGETPLRTDQRSNLCVLVKIRPTCRCVEDLVSIWNSIKQRLMLFNAALNPPTPRLHLNLWPNRIMFSSIGCQTYFYGGHISMVLNRVHHRRHKFLGHCERNCPRPWRKRRLYLTFGRRNLYAMRVICLASRVCVSQECVILSLSFLM